MDMLGVVARVNGISNDWIVEGVNEYVVERGLLRRSEPMPLSEAGYGRWMLVMWLYIYFGTLLLYFTAAGLDYLFFFVLLKER